MTLKTRFIWPLLALPLGGVCQAATPDIQTITAAAMNNNVEQLQSLLKQSDQPGYARAYLKFRLAEGYFSRSDAASADKLLIAARKELDTMIDANSEAAEAYALHSNVIGMRIGIKPMIRSFRLGPKSTASLKRALKLAPDNPRAWLFKGIAAHNTPAMFGGGNNKAIVALDKSIALFGDKPDGWGLADAYLWRGLSHKSNGASRKAITDFKAALHIAPEFIWAQQLLQQSELDQ